MYDAAVILFHNKPYTLLDHTEYLRQYTSLPIVLTSESDLRYTQETKHLFNQLKRLCRGPGKQYLHKVFFPFTLSHIAKRLIVLDSDIVVFRPLDSLARIPVDGIGLVREQASWYKSKFGKAYNGGLQILDVERIQSSECFNHSLHNFTKYIGWHGDQTFYSLLDCESLITTLPCDWNRQVGSFLMDKIKRYKTKKEDIQCDRGCSILHLNSKKGKQLLPVLRSKPTNCDAWKGNHVFTQCCQSMHRNYSTKI